MEQSESVAALAKALAAAQGELSSVPTNKANPAFNSHYADLGAMWEAARPILAKHSLSITQTFEPAPENWIAITTTISHASGEWRSGTLHMPAQKIPTKAEINAAAKSGTLPPMPVTPHSVGSAITYARRYSLGAILGMVTEIDDDANSAMGMSGKPPSASQPNSSKAEDVI